MVNVRENFRSAESKAVKQMNCFKLFVKENWKLLRTFLSFLGFDKVGGLDGLWQKFGTSMGKPLTSTVSPVTTATVSYTTVSSALNTMTATVVSSFPGNDTIGSCYKLTPYWGNLWRPLDDPDYPWLGLWTSLFITSVWYFCTDQVKHLIYTDIKKVL